MDVVRLEALTAINIVTDMSKAELMETARDLSEDDRLFLAAYLKHLTRVQTPAYRKEVTRLNDEFSQGKVFSMEQVQRLHDELAKEGL